MDSTRVAIMEHPPLYGNGSPVGIITPIFIAQTYFDITAKSLWIAIALTPTGWCELA
jgi:hypothetical protein